MGDIARECRNCRHWENWGDRRYCGRVSEEGARFDFDWSVDDDSGLRIELVTRPDFGCNDFEAMPV